jgi:peroxiredoxin
MSPTLAPVEDGGAAHLIPGARLPDVALASTAGGEVNLGTRPGAAIVYVYPWTGRPGLADPPGWDDIPGAHGSTPESVGFRAVHARFQELGFSVFGLSTQGSEHHCELVSRLDLPFAILSDEHFCLQKALRMPTFEASGTTYLKRLTLVVRKGRIARAFYPVHPPETHASVVLDWLVGPAPNL